MKIKTSNKHQQSYTCYQCPNYEFQDQRFLQMHNLKRHPEKCNKCDTNFGNQKSLKIHIKYAHAEVEIEDIGNLKKVKEEPKSPKQNDDSRIRKPSKSSPQKCDKCDTELSDKKSLKNHILEAHGMELFACEICNVSFAGKSNLTQHLRSKSHEYTMENKIKKESPTKNKHEILENNHKCHQCNKRFPSSAFLIRHVNIVHELKENFKCFTCHECFKNAKDLNEHLEDEHEGDFIKKECEFCPKSFKLAQKLQWHVGLYHAITCQSCLALRRALNEHVRGKHESGKKQEKCKACKSICLDLGNHMRMAHGGFNNA